MSSLFISDIHLTDNPRDAYRWNLFEWLRKKVNEYGISQIIGCGDYTDAKDRHSANLVNQFLDQLIDLSKLCKVFLLKGNHDYIDENTPFFGFVNALPNVTFMIEPYQITLPIGSLRIQKKCLFLPSTKNWKKEWVPINFCDYDIIFCHATFDGCKIENGTTLTGGIPPSIFRNFDGEVYSGDIHVPQMLSKIEYIGSPYRIHFGDQFNPRVVYIDEQNKQHNLYFPCTNKHLLTIGSISDLERQKDVKKGDQVKVRVLLRKSEYPDWKNLKQEIKQYCSSKEWELYGPELVIVKEATNILESQSVNSVYQTPSQIVEEYSTLKRIDKELVEIGLNIVDQLK